MNKTIKNTLIVLVAISAIWFIYSQSHPQPSVQGVHEENQLIVHFLDVGQGDATLIKTPHGDDILIDGGPDNTVIQKLGKYLPYGDWDIELMILTHPHSDHVTGLVEVLERYEVEKILMTGVHHTSPDYLAFLDLIKTKNIPTEIIDSPREVEIDDVVFQIIYPNTNFTNQRVEELNNTSIVAKMVYASTSVMFTGDLETEEGLLAQSMVQIDADIYQAGHHGSSNANDNGFVEMLSPDYVVISAGADNSYGHPHYRSLKNFQRTGAEIFRTDRNGDVVFIGDGEGLYPVSK